MLSTLNKLFRFLFLLGLIPILAGLQFGCTGLGGGVGGGSGGLPEGPVPPGGRGLEQATTGGTTTGGIPTGGGAAAPGWQETGGGDRGPFTTLKAVFCYRLGASCECKSDFISSPINPEPTSPNWCKVVGGIFVAPPAPIKVYLMKKVGNGPCILGGGGTLDHCSGTFKDDVSIPAPDETVTVKFQAYYNDCYAGETPELVLPHERKVYQVSSELTKILECFPSLPPKKCFKAPINGTFQSDPEVKDLEQAP